MKTDSEGAVSLMAQIAAASAASLAGTTNCLLAGQEDQYRTLAAAFVELFEYVSDCEREGRAPRERMLVKFWVQYDSCAEDISRSRLHPWPVKESQP